jgi:hypothetical protein
MSFRNALYQWVWNVIFSTTKNVTVQKPFWEAGSGWDSQQISGLLRNIKVYYRAHKTLPLDHVLSQMNPIHILTYYMLESKVSQVVSSLQAFRLEFCHNISYVPCIVHAPTHLIFIDLFTLIA